MKIRSCVWGFTAAAVLLAIGPVAGAEMFRCVAADGSVTFTDNAAACPRAEKHETSDRVQMLPSAPSDADALPAAPRSAPGSDASTSVEAEQAQKQVWQQKKSDAEARLRDVEARVIRLQRVVAGCNRGAEIVTRDATGLKYEVPCDEIRREHELAEAEAENLRDYLATGLRQECRESGCLPGWVR